MLYTIAHDLGSGCGVDMTFKNRSTPWLGLIEAELTESDRFTTDGGSSLKIELADADESRALKIARLIRNSFQLHMAPRSKVRLSTGVVLYNSGQSDKAAVLKVAENLAIKHSTDVGNKISFENHGTVSVDMTELP